MHRSISWKGKADVSHCQKVSQIFHFLSCRTGGKNSAALRKAPRGASVFFNLLKGSWYFPLLRCCFSSRGIRAAPVEEVPPPMQLHHSLPGCPKLPGSAARTGARLSLLLPRVHAVVPALGSSLFLGEHNNHGTAAVRSIIHRS